MGTYQEQIEANQKKKAARKMQEWILGAISDGITPLVVSGRITLEEGEQAMMKIVESLTKSRPEEASDD